MYLPEWEADNLIQKKNLGFEWVCMHTESWSTEEKGLVSNEQMFQRAKVLTHGFGAPAAGKAGVAVEGHMAHWDQDQHYGSLGMQVTAFQLIEWGFCQNHWICGN